MPNDDDDMSALADMSSAQPSTELLISAIGAWCTWDPGGRGSVWTPSTQLLSCRARGESPRTPSPREWSQPAEGATTRRRGTLPRADGGFSCRGAQRGPEQISPASQGLSSLPASRHVPTRRHRRAGIGEGRRCSSRDVNASASATPHRHASCSHLSGGKRARSPSRRGVGHRE